VCLRPIGYRRRPVIGQLVPTTDKLNDSVHFVEANHYYNGVQYNQYQSKKQQETQRKQNQRDREMKPWEMPRKPRAAPGLAERSTTPTESAVQDRLTAPPLYCTYTKTLPTA
jgi:hypothetical protein